MTALALRDDQTAWDEAQLAVLRSTGIDEDVTPAELQAYLHECQRRKLDPFTRQIYLLGRWDNQKQRKVYRSQTSIDGFRLIARRAADHAKESIENEDTLWCGPDGKWRDVWLADSPPAACKFVVLRNGKRFPAVARFSGYVQLNRRGEPMGLWQKMPDNQIAKCAEALALRKAFPEELGSLYTDDEMAQADNPQHLHAVHAEVISSGPAEADTRAPASKDQEWVNDARARAAAFTDDEGGRELWREASAKHKDGSIAKQDDDAIKQLILARFEELKTAGEAASQAEVVEGVIVQESALEPDDPWAAKVEAIASPEDAEAAEKELLEIGGDLPIEQGHRILAAIKARAAQVAA